MKQIIPGMWKCVKGLVYKETLEPCWWGSDSLKFGVKQVDRDQITTAKADCKADASSVSCSSFALRKG